MLARRHCWISPNNIAACIVGLKLMPKITSWYYGWCLFV